MFKTVCRRSALQGTRSQLQARHRRRAFGWLLVVQVIRKYKHHFRSGQSTCESIVTHSERLQVSSFVCLFPKERKITLAGTFWSVARISLQLTDSRFFFL